MITTTTYPNPNYTAQINYAIVELIIYAQAVNDDALVATVLDSAALTVEQYNAMVEANFANVASIARLAA